jgi:hypothetical protein
MGFGWYVIHGCKKDLISMSIGGIAAFAAIAK